MADRQRILKQAILLELRGTAFYRKVAGETAVEEVAGLFNMLASEEEEHARLLKRQYDALESGGEVALQDNAPGSVFEAADSVLPPAAMELISASGFEAAAISSAIDMENRAIRFYSERAAASKSDEERELYEWLAGWEEGHREVLVALDAQLSERFWNDNNFWPFD